MRILNKFKSFFVKNHNEQKMQLSDFQPGDFVELEYVDPKSIGIISENTLTFTRLNKDELNNRKIKGTIENIVWNPKLQSNLVYIKTFKKINDETIVRQYLFLGYEIKNIRKLQ